MNVTIEIPDEINQQLDNIKNLNSFIVELLNDYLEKQNTITEVNKTNDIINKTAGILSDKSINTVEWRRQIRDESENKQTIVVNDDVIKLTVQQQKNFVESLLNPEPPNDKLKKIAETYLIKTDE